MWKVLIQAGEKEYRSVNKEVEKPYYCTVNKECKISLYSNIPKWEGKIRILSQEAIFDKKPFFICIAWILSNFISFRGFIFYFY